MIPVSTERICPSKLSGLTQCRVSKLESGAAIPRLDTFFDYLDASGCVLRIEEKLGWEETATQMLRNTRGTHSVHQIILMIRNLP